MSKTCLYISFAIILTLFVVNLNANPKPKADNGIDIIINRLGPSSECMGKTFQAAITNT